MNTQTAVRELVIQLFDILFDGAGAGWFIGPLLILYFIFRFLRWAVATSRGGADLDELGDQAAEYRRRVDELPQRVSRTFRRRY